MKYMKEDLFQQKIKRRLLLNKLAKVIFLLSTLFGLLVLSILIYRVVSQGIGWIDLNFITETLSTNVEKAGIMGAILGTFWLMIVVIPVTMIVGIGTAIYLEIYVGKGPLQSFLQ